MIIICSDRMTPKSNSTTPDNNRNLYDIVAMKMDTLFNEWLLNHNEIF